MQKLQKNVTRKAMSYVTAPIAGQFLHVNDDGSIDITSCPHAATLFTNKGMAESYCDTLQGAIPLQGGWIVRNCASFQQNVITGTFDITKR